MDARCLLELVTGLEQTPWPGLRRPELCATGRAASACPCLSLPAQSSAVSVRWSWTERGCLDSKAHSCLFEEGVRGEAFAPHPFSVQCLLSLPGAPYLSSPLVFAWLALPDFVSFSLPLCPSFLTPPLPPVFPRRTVSISP